jgi:hypothetical protein
MEVEAHKRVGRSRGHGEGRRGGRREREEMILPMAGGLIGRNAVGGLRWAELVDFGTSW